MLKATIRIVVAMAMGSAVAMASAPLGAAVRIDDPATITGAIYLPYEAYNAPQMWNNFNAQETDRDLGYAREIHLNALRVWASYEYWKMAPDKFQARFDQFLAIAKKHHIRILISLFEQDGRELTPENMRATDPVHGIDVLQYHNNFPKSAQGMAYSLDDAVATMKDIGKPVWLTEWQRVRPSGSGFGKKAITKAEHGPDYSSLAPTVNKYPVATFFWSLMVKRVYLTPQRAKGTVNGLFWPDGSVVSLDDARSIANNPALQLTEKPLPAKFGREAAEAGAK